MLLCFCTAFCAYHLAKIVCQYYSFVLCIYLLSCFSAFSQPNLSTHCLSCTVSSTIMSCLVLLSSCQPISLAACVGGETPISILLYTIQLPSNMGCGSSSEGQQAKQPNAANKGGGAVGASGSGDGASKMMLWKQGKILGEGMSCQVVVVTNTQTKEKGALKKMLKPAKGSRVDDNKEMFEIETQILYKIKHAHILEIMDSWETTKEYCILTRLCSGGELFDRICEGPFTDKMAAAITQQMASALAHCHSANIVHRDLKPENFVYDSKNKNSAVRLIDFGCAVETKGMLLLLLRPLLLLFVVLVVFVVFVVCVVFVTVCYWNQCKTYTHR